TCNCSGRSVLQSFHVQPVKQNPRRKLSSGGLSTGTVIKNLTMHSSEFRYARQTLPSASELRPSIDGTLSEKKPGGRPFCSRSSRASGERSLATIGSATEAPRPTANWSSIDPDRPILPVILRYV